MDSNTIDDEEEINDADLLGNFDKDEEIIDLSHLRLKYQSLRKMPFQTFEKLQRLCLRQNEIKKFTSKDIGTLSSLQDLDLYDNALEKTYGEALRGCPLLESLDLSFNSIPSARGICSLDCNHPCPPPWTSLGTAPDFFLYA